MLKLCENIESIKVMLGENFFLILVLVNLAIRIQPSFIRAYLKLSVTTDLNNKGLVEQKSIPQLFTISVGFVVFITW